MRNRHRFACAPLACLLLTLAPGCLSIGGKTYQTDSPDADKRLTSLETRVGVLERALVGVPPPGGQPPPGTPYSPAGPPPGEPVQPGTPQARAFFVPAQSQPALR